MRMQWWLSALAVIGAISASPCLSAQPEEQVKSIHLEGEKARTLISLLMGGSYSDNGATNASPITPLTSEKPQRYGATLLTWG